MKNYKLVLSYDGSRYKGWQRLGKDELTIQETLENAVSQLLGKKVEIHGSGRTDAGVHARGQVASLKVAFALEKDFREKINQALPEDIRVLSVKLVAGNFHARYSAVEKIYRYFVDTNEKADVFRWKYLYHFPFQTDVEKMKKAAEYLIGTHDFSSFTDDKTVEKNKVRAIKEIQILEKNGQIEFVYRGDGFLQHMVRILTGTLLEVGRGDKNPEDVLMILEEKERAKAGFLVPAKGLFLDKVEYN